MLKKFTWSSGASTLRGEEKEEGRREGQQGEAASVVLPPSVWCDTRVRPGWL